MRVSVAPICESWPISEISAFAVGQVARLSTCGNRRPARLPISGAAATDRDSIPRPVPEAKTVRWNIVLRNRAKNPPLETPVFGPIDGYEGMRARESDARRQIGAFAPCPIVRLSGLADLRRKRAARCRLLHVKQYPAAPSSPMRSGKLLVQGQN